jgi:trimethylamine--corrinoid protein Co-methyltransferase
VLELGRIVAGGKDAYQERPLITHHCCPVISPLTMDVDSTESLIYLVEQELPIYGTIVPNAGLTAPMTLIGNLALGNAEFLAAAILMQMIRSGTPLIYAVLSTVADLRSGAYTPGAIETGLMQMAHSQMAQYYKVPSGGYIGLTNAHLNDAQCGYETGMNTTGAVLAGSDMLNMGGLLDSLMAFDFAKAVIDNEIALMLKRMVGFPKVDDEKLALDIIAQVGPGGSFMEAPHTFAHMRETGFLTSVANRDMRSTWVADGCPDINQRALDKARTILEAGNPAVFSADVDATIRKRFANMVAGDAKPIS